MRQDRGPGPDPEAVVEHVSRRTGVSFTGSRGDQLREAVMRAVGEGGRPGWRPGRAPARALVEDAVFERICDSVTVQESFFLRERGKLEWLARTVFPTLRCRSAVRVWSAGCAAGEEAYTLSSLLLEAGLGGRYEVLGTDLSPEAVAAARRGDYGRWALRGLDEATVARLFRVQDGRYHVREQFRAGVSFRQHNLLDPPPGEAGQFDVVLCRNVLIYFTAEATARAVDQLLASLAPGGWLVLGASDPLLDDVPGVEPVTTGSGLVYRRAAHQGAAETAATVRRRPEQGPVGVASPSRPAPRRPPAQRVTAATGTLAARPHRPAPADTRSVEELLAAAHDALVTARPREAEHLARRALDVPAPPPAAYSTLVQALAQDDRLPEAVGVARSGVAAHPLDAGLRHLQAVLLLDTEHPAAAAAAAQRAIYLDPGLPEAHLVLARARDVLGDARASRRARETGQRLLAQRQVGR